MQSQVDGSQEAVENQRVTLFFRRQRDIAFTLLETGHVILGDNLVNGPQRVSRSAIDTGGLLRRYKSLCRRKKDKKNGKTFVASHDGSGIASRRRRVMIKWKKAGRTGLEEIDSRPPTVVAM